MEYIRSLSWKISKFIWNFYKKLLDKPNFRVYNSYRLAGANSIFKGDML